MTYSSASGLLDPLLSKMRPMLASSIQRQLNRDGALFLSAALSVADFHRLLREREIESVLLPHFFSAAEIELLIADEDLDRIDGLVTKWPAGHSIKLYSSSGGRREHRFNPPGDGARAQNALAMFPPHLANALIGRAIVDDAGLRRLTPVDAFLACAYRATYLQSECWTQSGAEWTAVSECETRLRDLASKAELSLEGPVTPQTLDCLLDECGWRPSLDLLERAAHWMSWIRQVLSVQGEEEEAPGVTLFFFRSRAVDAGWQPRILECLRDHGFELLSIVELDDAQARRAAVEFRGGNWGRGPYRVSGGPPSAICIALDLLPIPPKGPRAEFPDCDNARILDAKSAARDLVNAGAPRVDHYNPVHSTDNSAQSWRAVRSLIPEEEQSLRQKIAQLRDRFATDDIIRDLTKNGRRAKVELIQYNGMLAVRKTFRPSALSFMQREIEVMRRLAPLRREIPRLLESGENYIVMEHVGGGAMPPSKRRADGRPRPLPLRHVRNLAKLIAASMANGFDPIDLRADGNVIYTPSGLHLIDFEFWRACDPGPPEKSMCLSGIPAGDMGQRPLAAARNKNPYRIGWYPYTLLSVESFLYDPAPIQTIKRSANLIRGYGSWAMHGCYSLAKRGLSRLAKVAIGAGMRVIGPRAMRFLALH